MCGSSSLHVVTSEDQTNPYPKHLVQWLCNLDGILDLNACKISLYLKELIFQILIINIKYIHRENTNAQRKSIKYVKKIKQATINMLPD